MEIKEGERVVVAKPVASRPSCSTFRSFSELLAGAINASPSNVTSETAVAAIRPKTVRFKPTLSRAPAGLISSQAEISGTAIQNSSDNVTKSDSKPSPTVVYKPLAKLVSKTTVSLLANMGSLSTNHHQQQPQALRVMQPVEKHNFKSNLSSNLRQNIPSRTTTNQTSETSKTPPRDLEEDPKSLPPTKASVDRPSYDGYNWRKYGQKQVKGSEYPRSYYKCTHPNCPVKKKVERSFDGQIAEIVYKGEHNHSKPQPPKRNSSGAQGSGLVVPEGAGQGTASQLWNSHANDGSEGRVENQNEVGLLSAQLAYQGNALVAYDPVVNGVTIAGGATPDNSCGVSGECEEGSKGIEADNDEPRSKRRKMENQASEVGVSGEPAQEPRIVVQSSNDTDIIGDGFRWRKYGQKVVKGNPYPRSYYRCTSLKCNVRKHVERASDDPKAFITTYEGKHNHDMPLKTTNAAASEPDSQAASKDKP